MDQDCPPPSIKGPRCGLAKLGLVNAFNLVILSHTPKRTKTSVTFPLLALLVITIM